MRMTNRPFSSNSLITLKLVPSFNVESLSQTTSKSAQLIQPYKVLPLTNFFAQQLLFSSFSLHFHHIPFRSLRESQDLYFSKFYSVHHICLSNNLLIPSLISTQHFSYSYALSVTKFQVKVNTLVYLRETFTLQV